MRICILLHALNSLHVLSQIPEHKLLKLIKVRWLSLNAVVNRYVEQYDALFTFFENESKKRNPEVIAIGIFNRLKNRCTILYLRFLKYILPIICHYNLEFQCEKPKVYELYAKMEALFKVIVEHYLNEEYVINRDPEFIEFETITKENHHIWEPLRKVFLGPLVSAELSSLPSNIPTADSDAFREICRKFFITFAQQLCLRFPFKERHIKILKDLKFVEPIHLKTTKHIVDVGQYFRYDPILLHDEFKKLKFHFKDNFELDA